MYTAVICLYTNYHLSTTEFWNTRWRRKTKYSIESVEKMHIRLLHTLILTIQLCNANMHVLCHSAIIIWFKQKFCTQCLGHVSYLFSLILTSLIALVHNEINNERIYKNMRHTIDDGYYVYNVSEIAIINSKCAQNK